jgi:hypothetical protein
MDGSRTHRGPHRDPLPILKTGGPTGIQPFPRLRIPHQKGICKPFGRSADKWKWECGDQPREDAVHYKRSDDPEDEPGNHV